MASISQDLSSTLTGKQYNYPDIAYSNLGFVLALT